MKFMHSITFSFTHVIFSHNLHICLWLYTSMKQGHACLPSTSSFPVHVAMPSLHESRFSTSWSPNSLNPARNGAPIDCTTSIHSTQWFVNVPHTFLRQWHYLSDDRVLKYMCAINISVATSQFSHCYLYSGIRKKKCGHYFLSNLRI
jgi:hypothetical protein